MVVGMAHPDNFITSTEKGFLRIPTNTGDIRLPCYVFDDKNLRRNLIGLSPLRNAGCKITLTTTDIIIDKEREILWQGFKNREDTLWKLNVAELGAVSPRIGSALQTIRHDTNAEFVRFVYAVFGSCPAPTLLAAVDKGWLANKNFCADDTAEFSR